MRDSRVCVSQASAQIVRFEIGIIGKNSFLFLALSKKAQNHLDRDSHPANDRLAAEDFRIRCNTSQQLFVNYVG